MQYTDFFSGVGGAVDVADCGVGRHFHSKRSQ